MTSSSGPKWARLPLDPGAFQPADAGFCTQAVTYAANRFVAVGDLAYTSLDGESWTAHPVPPLSAD